MFEVVGMIDIRNVSKMNTKEISRIAELHKAAFPAFFLTQLGLPFLKSLYAGYIEDDESGIIVAEEENRLVGFVAYSKNYPLFFKKLVKHHLIRFAICSIGATIRHPSFARRLLGAFKKSDSVVKREQYVELASICVDPSMEKKGIGSSLIDYLIEMVDFNKYAYINLETDAIDNEDVNRFYKNKGFRLEREYTTPEGRKMNEEIRNFCKSCCKND